VYEVCLIRIKEQVGEKRNTVCTPNITNMLSIKKLEHVDDITFRELKCSERVGSVCSTSGERRVTVK
jgi:hypothetical protein